MISAQDHKGGFMAKCVVCSCELPEKDMQHLEIKGKIKKVCQECVTAIKGLA